MITSQVLLLPAFLQLKPLWYWHTRQWRKSTQQCREQELQHRIHSATTLFNYYLQFKAAQITSTHTR